MSSRPEELLANEVYLVKKHHEIKEFDERALETAPEHVLRKAEERSRDYEGLELEGLILDVGCGLGPDALAMVRSGPCEVVGIDISLGAIRMAKRASGGLPIHLLVADATALPFRPEAFDGANVGYVLHHHPWPVVKALLSGLAGVLKPGGVLVIKEPCPCDEGTALAWEVEAILHDLWVLKELAKATGVLARELRSFLYLRSGLFGFGHLYPTLLKAFLAQEGFSILRSEVRRVRRDYTQLLDRAEERARLLPLDEPEEAYIMARIADRRGKMRSIRPSQPCALFLLAQKGVLVGRPGFEPGTSSASGRRPTRLDHRPHLSLEEAR